jgi:hypothetical protein
VISNRRRATAWLRAHPAEWRRRAACDGGASRGVDVVFATSALLQAPPGLILIEMDKAEVDRWLGSYVEAWKTYDPDLIGALFADDIEYRYHPYDDPVVGRDAVVASWVGESDTPGVSARDAPGTYDAHYAAIAVDGEVAVATGVTAYYASGGSVDKVFHNCFVMRFDGGMRCTEFTEWYMELPPPAATE